jgi:PAS domain S-box-containing protein
MMKKIPMLRNTKDTVLPESEAELRQVSASLVDILVVCDGEGHLLGITPAESRLLPQPAKKLIGKSVKEIFPELLSSLFFTTIQQVLLDGETRCIEYPMLVRGRNLWFEATISRRNEETVFWAAREKSKYHVNEEKLRFRLDLENLLITLLQKFLQLPFENVDVEIERALRVIGLFLRLDDVSVFKFDNTYQTMIRSNTWISAAPVSSSNSEPPFRCDDFPWLMSRLSNFETINLTCLDELPPEANAEKKLLKQQKIKSTAVVPMAVGDILRGFVLFASRKTEISWSEDTVALLRVLADMFSNALEHHQAEERLQRSEARTMALLSAMPDMMFRLNRQGILLDFTGGDEEDLFLADEFIGQSLARVLPEDIFQRFLESIEKTLEDKKIQTLEYEQELSRGQQHYEVRFVVSSNEEVIAIVRNTSEQARLERLKTDFVHRATHELRTPLTTCLLMADLIDGQGTDEQKSEYWKVLRTELQRQRSLVEDLLTAARLENSPYESRLKSTDLVEVIKSVLSGLVHVAESKKITIVADAPVDFPAVNADAKAMQQVFSNLIGNAIKFTPQGGKVTLSMEIKAKRAIVKVQDTGIGIPEEDFSHLFTRFYRASNAVQSEIPGTGIGLYIVKAILDSLDGKITIESQPGVGTTFTIDLPVAKDK